MSEPVDAATARRAMGAVTLPVLAPGLLTHMEPSRIASRFDAAAMAAGMLQEPALVLAMYAAGQQQGGAGATDPQTLMETLGPQGVERAIRSLRLVSPPTDPAARAWLDAGCRHALAVSRLAAVLAPAMNLNPRTAAAAGLLHDVGRLLLLTSPLAGAALAAYDYARGVGLSNIYVERSLLGLSHKQFGRELCDRCGVPEAIADTCTSHDFTPAQRLHLPPAAGPMSSLIGLCNTLAIADGLVGDPAAELRPFPGDMRGLVTAHDDDIRRTLDQVRADAEQRWPLCRDSDEPGHEAQHLADLRITLASPEVEGGEASPWHPIRRTLEGAGAQVIPTSWPPSPSQAATKEASQCHLLVIDASAEPLASVMDHSASLPRLWPGVSRLVLAQRCHEPEDRVRNVDATCALLATPIRAEPLFHAIRRVSRPR